MTTPCERTRAVIDTREFLQQLRDTPEVRPEFREQARKLLRHYPIRSCIQLASLALPNTWASVLPE